MSSVPPPPPPPPPGPGRPPQGGEYVSASSARSVGGLSRIAGLTTASVAVTAVLIALSISGQLLQLTVIDDARDLVAGRIDDEQFITAFGPAAMMQLLGGIAQAALGVLTMVLWFKMARNLRALGRQTRWAPGWAIGGWFVPPLVLYVIPHLMLRELWRASDPSIPWDQPSPDWRASRVPPIITLWWVLFGLVPLVLLFVQGATSPATGFGSTDLVPLAEQVADQWMVSAVATVVSTGAAVCWVVILRTLGARHRAFTGENAA